MKEKIIRKIKQSWVVILITIILSTSFALASDEVYKSISQFLDFVIKFFSWGWVFFAIIAGKLMTNDWIFGFGMDKYLFAMWNVMKNFANFAIGFAFLFLILYSFFKGQPGALIKQYLGKLLLAAVLINISWFVILVVLDIALILTMAVADIPSSLIGKIDYENKLGLKQNVCEQAKKIEYNTVIVDFNANGQMISFTGNKITDADCDSLFDKFLPKADSVSGPLIYLGASVLNMYDTNFLKADKIDFKSLSLNKILNALIAIMFILPLFVLMVVNFVRIFWIWMFIVFSPFVMIDAVFGNKFASKMGGKLQKLTLSNFIGLVFMPVAVVGTMSIAILFVMSLHNILQGDNTNNAQQVKLEGLIVNDKEVGMEMLKCGENKACSKVDINFGQVASGAGKFVGGVIGWLILVILSIVFLWSILQIGFKTSQITASISDGIFKFTSDVAKAMPVLPGGISFGALKQAQERFTTDALRYFQSKQAGKLEEKIDQIFGLDKSDLTQLELNRLRSALKDTDPGLKTAKFFRTLSTIASNKETLSLHNERVKGAIKMWLDELASTDKGGAFLINLGLGNYIDVKSKRIKDRDKLWNDTNFGKLLTAFMDKEQMNELLSPGLSPGSGINYTQFQNIVSSLSAQYEAPISLDFAQIAKKGD